MTGPQKVCKVSTLALWHTGQHMGTRTRYVRLLKTKTAACRAGVHAKALERRPNWGPRGRPRSKSIAFAATPPQQGGQHAAGYVFPSGFLWVSSSIEQGFGVMLSSTVGTAQLRLLGQALGGASWRGAQVLASLFSTSRAAPLSDEDRIYTNLYGRHGGSPGIPLAPAPPARVPPPASMALAAVQLCRRLTSRLLCLALGVISSLGSWLDVITGDLQA